MDEENIDLQVALFQVLLFVPVGKKNQNIRCQKRSASAINSTSFTNTISVTVIKSKASLKIQQD